jgi:hypothetical protein
MGRCTYPHATMPSVDRLRASFAFSVNAASGIVWLFDRAWVDPSRAQSNSLPNLFSRKNGSLVMLLSAHPHRALAPSASSAHSRTEAAVRCSRRVQYRSGAKPVCVKSFLRAGVWARAVAPVTRRADGS